MEKYFRKPWSSSALILAAPIHRGLTSPVPGTNVKIMKYTTTTIIHSNENIITKPTLI